MWQKLAVLLEMIKFRHSVFALPFALMALVLAAGGWPPLRVLFWVVVAMVSARTAAMTFNRIVDRRFDAENPRTAGRAIPAGLVGLKESWLLVLGSSALFFWPAHSSTPVRWRFRPLPWGSFCSTRSPSVSPGSATWCWGWRWGWRPWAAGWR